MKLNKVNIFGAFNFIRRSWAIWAIGSKEKPKSHLGILKRAKDQKRAFILSKWEGREKREQERNFHFWKKRAAARGNDFQGNVGT